MNKCGIIEMRRVTAVTIDTLRVCCEQTVGRNRYRATTIVQLRLAQSPISTLHSKVAKQVLFA